MSTTTQDNTDRGLFSRMTQQTENDTDNNIETNERTSATITDNNENIIVGSELMASLSEFSLTINHDDKYSGDYIKIHNLICSITK